VKHFTFLVEDRVYDELENLSQQLEVPKSWIARQGLKLYLKHLRKQLLEMSPEDSDIVIYKLRASDSTVAR